MKNTLLVLLTLFKFPASKKANSCGRLVDPLLLDAFNSSSDYHAPNGLPLCTVLRGLDTRWQYLLIRFLCGVFGRIALNYHVLSVLQFP